MCVRLSRADCTLFKAKKASSTRVALKVTVSYSRDGLVIDSDVDVVVSQGIPRCTRQPRNGHNELIVI